MKIELMLEDWPPYEAIPVDTPKGEQHAAAFRAINPNGKVPATSTQRGRAAAQARVFDSSSHFCFTSRKDRALHWRSRRRPRTVVWLLFIATGVGVFRQAGHSRHAAPEKMTYAVNRYRRRSSEHYSGSWQASGRQKFIVGGDYHRGHVRVGWLHGGPRACLPGARTGAEFPESQSLYETRRESRCGAARAIEGSTVPEGRRRRDRERDVSGKLPEMRCDSKAERSDIAQAPQDR